MLNSKGYWRTLVIGSTFAGIGAACNDMENTFIVDSTSLVGYEFINCFNAGKAWNDVKLSEKGADVKKDLMGREILSSESIVHIPEVAPVLYKRITDEKLRMLLMTDVVDIQRSNGSFIVTIHNVSGFQKLTAERVIDTRCDGISYRRISAKSINAIIHSIEDTLPVPGIKNDRVRLEKGKYPGDCILKVQLAADDDWIAARHKLHRFWAERPGVLRDWSMAAVADMFETKPAAASARIEDNWHWLPSSACANPLEAFEAGGQYVNGGAAV